MIEVHYPDLAAHKSGIHNNIEYITGKSVRKWLKVYKKQHCCEICGTHKKLTVHHTVPERKTITFGNMHNNSHLYPIYVIKNELKHC